MIKKFNSNLNTNYFRKHSKLTFLIKELKEIDNNSL